jgi:hypothetical protein
MASKLDVTNDAGNSVTITLDGQVAVSGGANEAQIIVGRQGFSGTFIVRDVNGEEVFRLESPFGAHFTIGSKQGLAGFVHVLDGFGKDSILLDGSSGNINCNGDIKLSGADCAELFDIDPAETSTVEPGTVLVIGDEGALRPCDRPADRRVAGIVSGAGGFRPGLILNAQKSNGVPVALIGRVFCKVDAACAPIEVGDLLTTSSTPGHAMKAEIDARAGTVLGKAMERLLSGQGLIPVLLTLR